MIVLVVSSSGKTSISYGLLFSYWTYKKELETVDHIQHRIFWVPFYKGKLDQLRQNRAYFFVKVRDSLEIAKY